MSDLEIDPAALQAVRDKATTIENLADRSVRQLGRLSADGVGPSALVARVGTLEDAWTRGMGQLGVFAASIAESLTVAEQTFEDVDNDLSTSTSGER